MTHPYKNLSDHCFWSKAMLTPAPGQIDPVSQSKEIKATDKISSMGSCFAQHIAKNIAASGFHYFVAETAPGDMSSQEAIKRNFGTFSARYGNIYTPRQAVQLFDRAFDLYAPEENIWTSGNNWVDAFRPNIQENGFTSKEELLADRASHLSCVRTVFKESNWLIFTLGLTEAWRSKRDAAIFPMAPGVAGGTFDPNETEFVNFTVDEIIRDLSQFIEKIKSVNPEINILLTLSPVPLIATYEKRHVLVSTAISKAILRVAADEVEKKFANVIYFPSYEIITSPANGTRYYRDDLRQVTDIGVNHVMRMFYKHFMPKSTENFLGTPLNPGEGIGGAFADIVCDEAEIENALKQSGF